MKFPELFRCNLPEKVILVLALLCGVASLISLSACSGTKVTPRPIPSEKYEDVPYQGQVPVRVQQQLDKQYPKGFYESSSSGIPPGERKRISIKTFSSRPSFPNLEQSFSEVFASAFTRSDAFTVVEREQLDQVISEFELNQSGLMDQNDSPQTGNMESAQILITGDIIQVGNVNRIEARAIDMQSGRVLVSLRVSPPAFTIQSAETLAGRLIRRLQQIVYD